MRKKLTSVLKRTSRLLQVGMGVLAAALIVCQPGGSGGREPARHAASRFAPPASTPTRPRRPTTAGMRRPTPATADRDVQLAALSPSAVAITPPRRAPLQDVVIDVM